MKYGANGKIWVTQAIFIDNSSRCQNGLSKCKKIVFSLDLCGADPQDACYLVSMEVFYPLQTAPAFSSHLPMQ